MVKFFYHAICVFYVKTVICSILTFLEVQMKPLFKKEMMKISVSGSEIKVINAKNPANPIIQESSRAY